MKLNWILIAFLVPLCGTAGFGGTVRGWLSDEECARTSAANGSYAGNNPECVKQCVAKGKRVVLVDPDQKRVLDITNDQMTRDHLGDYVEVVGNVDPTGLKVRIASLKLLRVGAAACARPPSSKK